jgi:hypothetical protein
VRVDLSPNVDLVGDVLGVVFHPARERRGPDVLPGRSGKHRAGQPVTPRWWTGRPRLSGTAHVERAAFLQPIGDRCAIVNGGSVMTVDEIQAVIRALRENDIF